MFITDQHRQQVCRYFAEMNKYMEILEQVTSSSINDFRSDSVLQAAGERALQIMLECTTDIGNLIIDALIMRDPSSYEDIIEILSDEHVLPKQFADSLIEVVKFRRILTHDYLKLDLDQLYDMITVHKHEFIEFQKYISDYMKLTPANCQ